MNFFSGLTVLVTGGAGFIGSHIVEKLVNLGAHVTVLDNLSTGSLDNLQNVKGHFNFIHGDINNFEDCRKACAGQKIVFHLAAKISVAESIKNPAPCYETNVVGTLHMLQACVAQNVQRFVFSSSAAVYGAQENPCHEEMVCRPESPYGTSKLLGELLCKDFYQQHNLETVCLRYFNVYGERQNPNGTYAAVVAAFKNCMQKQKPITIFGDGMQTRDFISVDEVANANITLAAAQKNLVAGQIFNIGTGTSITLLELIEKLKKDFPGYQEPIEFLPARTGDIKHSQAVCEKYKNIGKFLE
jgi:nucleoside-diphosphate-sugar epimerase